MIAVSAESHSLEYVVQFALDAAAIFDTPLERFDFHLQYGSTAASTEY